MRAAVFGVVVASLAPPAGAQPVAPGADQNEADRPVLEVVIASARRREENVQTSPVSVTALSANELSRRSATTIQDVAAFTPNLRRSAGPQGGSSGHYFSRGIGQLDFIASTDPGVGVYLDGVYLGRTTGATFDLLDVERVEIVRGPQGTLFGRNTIGGAINVITAAAPEEARGSAAMIVADRNRREGRLDLGGPLGDGAMRANLAVLAKSSEGWQRRLTDGQRFGDERTYAARGVLDWNASDALTLRATIDATRSRGTADPHYLAAANDTRGGRPEYVVSDPATTWSGQLSRDDLDVHGTSLTITYDLPRMTIKAIAGYRDIDSNTGIDFDGSPFTDLDQQVLTRQSQTSAEVQLAGESSNSRVTWLTGAFFFREDVQQGVPIVFYGDLISQNNDLDNRSTALFSHVTYSIGRRLSVSGGARLNVDSKQHTFDHFLVGSAGNVPLFPVTTLDDRWRSFTPKIGFEYIVGDQSLFYSSLSQGFRSGGFNGRPFGIDEFLSYEPESLITLESGFKSEWLDRRLRFNVAAFTSDYDDIQLSRTSVSADGTPIVVTGNAGEAAIRGFEVEFTAAATERFLLSASIGTIHNKYTRVEPGAAVDLQSKLPVSPAQTMSAAAQYTHPLRSGTIGIGIDGSYTSRFNYFFENPPLSWEEPYRVWNARLSYAPRAEVEFALFVLNATDEDYSVFREDVRSTFGVAIVWPARPREWGVEARFEF